ncbi:MAG: type II toxin-antitoxin system HicB family antitoxin [Acidobacteria bacterium]|nr:type II toxin-antitoxin system HicB family antitoxin [Acidobacteriota bacterium]
MMEYRGYQAKPEYDDETKMFRGRVLHVLDVITFEGRTVDELETDFHAAVDDYLKLCEESGEKPERPFSGRFIVRVSPELHRAIALAATKDDKSINTWVIQALENALGIAPWTHVSDIPVLRGFLSGAAVNELLTSGLRLTSGQPAYVFGNKRPIKTSRMV